MGVRSPTGPIVTPEGLSDRIRALEAELVALRQQQRAELLLAIVILIGPGVVFSSKELWQHRVVSPAWACACDEAGIRSARQLGKRLQQIQRAQQDNSKDLMRDGITHYPDAMRLARVGADHDGALWVCE